MMPLEDIRCTLTLSPTPRPTRSQRVLFSQLTLLRSTPIITTALPFSVRLDAEGGMKMQLIA
jgi:hypothetical protein